MPVLGIDIGTTATKLATVGRGGVAIVRNDLAERLTPTLVSYTDAERLIGDAALTSLKSNSKVTARSFKNLLGASTSTDNWLLASEAPYALMEVGADPSTGRLGYLAGRQKDFISPTEVLVPFLKKLISMGQAFTEGAITSVTIGVPSWFADHHRSAVVDACQVIGMECNCVMSHSTATALDYGLFRQSTFPARDADPYTIMFVDSGCSQLTVTVVNYNSGQLDIVMVEENVALGSRAIDQLIMEYTAREFMEKNPHVSKLYNVSGSGAVEWLNFKTRLKLEEACEKAKRVLSANRETTIHLECFHEDTDLTVNITRDQLVDLAAGYRQSLTQFCQECAQKIQGLGRKIQALEICGGGTRVPFVQEALQGVFQIPLSRTVSADECVARGCAIQAAMLDPRYRVTQFRVIDRRADPIFLTVASADVAKNLKEVDVSNAGHTSGFGRTENNQQVVLFPPFSPCGHIRCVEFPIQSYQNQDLQCTLTSVSNRTGAHYYISSYTIKVPKEVLSQAMSQNPPNCRLKVRFFINVHLAVSIDAAFYRDIVEEEKYVEKVPRTEKNEKGEDVEVFDEIPRTRSKTVVKKTVLSVNETRTPLLYASSAWLEEVVKKEATMENRDRETQHARDLRNEILSTCFKYREAIKPESNVAQFVTNEDRKQIQEVTEECADFAEYNEGLSVQEYSGCLDRLVNAWAPVKTRHDAFLAEERRKEEEIAAAAAAAAAAEQREKEQAEKLEQEKAAAADTAAEPTS